LQAPLSHDSREWTTPSVRTAPNRAGSGRVSGVATRQNRMTPKLVTRGSLAGDQKPCATGASDDGGQRTTTVISFDGAPVPPAFTATILVK
jgi:hypothetical protein